MKNKITILLLSITFSAFSQNKLDAKLEVIKTIYDSYGKISFVFNQTISERDIKVKPINYNFNQVDTLITYNYDLYSDKDTLIFWFKNINQKKLSLQVLDGNKEIKTQDFELISKEEALKRNVYPSKLTLINKTNNQTLIFCEDSVFFWGNRNLRFKLQFIAPITEIKIKKPISFTADNKNIEDKSSKFNDNRNLTFSGPFTFGKDIKNVSGTQIIHPNHNHIYLEQWDSTAVIEDKKNKGTMISSPEINLVQIKHDDKVALNKVYELKIPAGTFIDFFGNKNEEIIAVWKNVNQKRK